MLDFLIGLLIFIFLPSNKKLRDVAQVDIPYSVVKMYDESNASYKAIALCDKDNTKTWVVYMMRRVSTFYYYSWVGEEIGVYSDTDTFPLFGNEPQPPVNITNIENEYCTILRGNTI